MTRILRMLKRGIKRTEENEYIKKTPNIMDDEQ
jgi:hypothetical protein